MPYWTAEPHMTPATGLSRYFDTGEGPTPEVVASDRKGRTSQVANRLRASNLRRFERAGGLQTSTHRTGDQWDAPFGWAPLQWIAVEGMRRYGYRADAERIEEVHAVSGVSLPRAGHIGGEVRRGGWAA